MAKPYRKHEGPDGDFGHCARRKRRLKPGDTVIEYTGGSTGASLALVCLAKGYLIHVVSSTAFSQEKLDQMVAYGAQLTLVPRDKISRELFLEMIAAAEELSEQPNSYWTNQLENTDMGIRL